VTRANVGLQVGQVLPKSLCTWSISRANSSAAPAPLLGPPGPTPGAGLAKSWAHLGQLLEQSGPSSVKVVVAPRHGDRHEKTARRTTSSGQLEEAAAHSKRQLPWRRIICGNASATLESSIGGHETDSSRSGNAAPNAQIPNTSRRAPSEAKCDRAYTDELARYHPRLSNLPCVVRRVLPLLLSPPLPC